MDEYVVYVVYEYDTDESLSKPHPNIGRAKMRGKAYDAEDAEQRAIAMLVNHGVIEDSIFIEDVVEVPQWFMMQKYGEPMLPGLDVAGDLQVERN
jgi:hypothetical protein